MRYSFGHRFDLDAILYWMLLSLVLFAYILVVYFVMVNITLPSSFLSQNSQFNLASRIFLNFIALLVLFLTLRPIYFWASTGIRDLVYGQHETLYPALAQLNQHLESTPSPQTVLPTIASTIAATLKLPYVEIEAYKPGEYRTEAVQTTSFGVRPSGVELEPIPLLYHNVKIGELRVAAQRWHVPLSPSDLTVLHELARQVGIALYAAQLTDDLQRTRERLVLGREEERRRIRNDLHDELAPTLSSLHLQLSAVRQLIHIDPNRAVALTTELGNDLRAATAEIRQLIYDLRPPMLDELGLVGAIKNFRLNDSILRLEIIAPEPLPKIPAALEVAVYRITSEALHNVVKHAKATECEICIAMSEHYLTLTITDNGEIESSHYVAGIGLRSMHERAAELGGTLVVQPATHGGTEVFAQLPIAF